MPTGSGIVSWNCGDAMHRKWQYLMELEPDIAVVPEACQPEWVLPLSVTGPAEFILIAVWAVNRRTHRPLPEQSAPAATVTIGTFDDRVTDAGSGHAPIVADLKLTETD